MVPVVSLSKFTRGMLSVTSDFCCHLWEPTDLELYKCLSSVVTAGLNDKLFELVDILKELRTMSSFFVREKEMMDECTQFQPLVKRLLIKIVEVLIPGQNDIKVEACQGQVQSKLSKQVTIKGIIKGTMAMLRGESDLVRVVGEERRYFELKPDGGALYQSNARQAKDQALGQTVCSSTAIKNESVVAIGSLMDLFTVSMIVTVPMEGGGVVSQISKRTTSPYSWVLRVALLLVASTDSITELLPKPSDETIVPMFSDDESVVEEVDVGGLNLHTPARTPNLRGATSSSSSGPPMSGASLSQQTEDDAVCRWIAREALRDRHEKKVRAMLEADATSEGFSFLCKENLDKINERATTVRPHGDLCRAFGVFL
jgi:hypothetical protein